MSGFGDKLRREREMRGISLEEISESTKIGTRSLRALEEEDFEKLPGGIFNKGFVRAYSRFLGLDEDQTVADFEGAWQEFKTAKGQPEEVATEEDARGGESTYFWLLTAIAVLVLAIAAGWYLIRHHHIGETNTSSPHLGDAAQNSSSRSTPSSGSSSSSPVLSPPKAPPLSESVISPGAKTLQSDPQKAAPGAATDSVAGSSTTAERRLEKSPPAADVRAADANAPIQLKVFAREDSWLSVSADGKNLGQGILSAQKSRTIRAQNEIRLKLGNVGGVEVSFNGKAVDIDGEPRQVKELTFTTTGLRR